jgi:fluoride exporter
LNLPALAPHLRAPLAISLGAVPGALCRYYLTQLSMAWFGTGVWGTLAINLSGAMVMGLFVSFTLERMIPSPELRLLIAVGFLGSYTTFSTYALETMTMLRQGNWAGGLSYGAGSLVFGIFGVAVGNWLGQVLARL